MPNTYAPANLATLDRDRLRLIIGDTQTTPGQYIFEDLEIDEFLRQQSDLYSAAALACRALATSQSKLAVAITLLGSAFTIDKTAISRRYLDMADAFDKRAEAEPFSVQTRWKDGDQDYVRQSLTNEDQLNFEDASGS